MGQFNGNISGQLWGAGASLPNAYVYRYDVLNRLTSGARLGTAMSEVLAYDAMGNITSMNRDGVSGTYNYNGHRLVNISGGLATGSYAYDANGNATTDGRTGVTLGYNYLNLPATASKTGVLNMAYTYDATGRKLRKVVTGGTPSATDYVDGIQYNGSTIDFIQTAEGRAVNSGGSYSYQYNLSDHLGNVRYSFDIQAGVVGDLQRDDYYPFGKRKEGTYVGNNRYLYNGKELQEELGQYDYGARFYDPEIGRWNVVDPLAHHSFDKTPFHFCSNNPLNRVDPNGMCDSPNCPHKKVKNVYLQAGFNKNVLGPAEKGIKDVDNAFEASAGVGFGIGFTSKMGSIDFSGEVVGPNIGFGLKGGEISLEGNIVKGGSLEWELGSMKTDLSTTSIGTFSLSLSKPKDGFKLGYVDTDKSLVSLNTSTNTKTSVGVSSDSPSALSIGGRLGVVYADFSADFIKLAQGFKNFSDATKNYFNNLVKSNTDDR
ncbi:MAG: RHS repeat-associated core domain-containing protein [Flavobacteriales bacterium]|nr:MAG: RHS repeat-associated core domain-containing protein [Flavobacteriales bacterium]